MTVKESFQNKVEFNEWRPCDKHVITYGLQTSQWMDGQMDECFLVFLQ